MLKISLLFNQSVLKKQVQKDFKLLGKRLVEGCGENVDKDHEKVVNASQLSWFWPRHFFSASNCLFKVNN